MRGKRPDEIETVKVEMQIPKTCSDCPFHRLSRYRVHNETGLESVCGLGYMKNEDTRDKYFRDTRYEGCGLEENMKI